MNIYSEWYSILATGDKNREKNMHIKTRKQVNERRKNRN